MEHHGASRSGVVTSLVRSPTRRAAADTAPFVAPALARLPRPESHGVTAVASRSVRVNSSVAATAVPLCRSQVEGRAAEREGR